jgi:nitrite reductase (NADH) small subunit
MPVKHPVARVEDIPPGGRKILKVKGREVGVFNLGGTYYALKNVCVHQGARVCLGKVTGTTLPSKVYEFKYGREGQILRCPWHGWEYDITSGRSLFDEKVGVVSYPVSVEDGQIFITM